MSYAEAIETAQTYWGENWWRSCTITSRADVHSTNFHQWYIRWVTPKLGATRPH